LSTVSFTRGATYHGATARTPVAFHILGEIAYNLRDNYDAIPLTDERVEIEEEK
jgi:hypothetical protein